MTHRSSTDEKLTEVVVHSWLAEAHRSDEGEARTAAFDDDEQKLIPQLAKAFDINVDDLTRHYASYDGLQRGQDAGMQAARRGEKKFADHRVNPQYYKATSLTHLVNLLMAKEDVGIIDGLAQRGVAYAAGHVIEKIPAHETEIARRVGAISMVEEADLGAMFGWPTDDRAYEGISPQGNYLGHFFEFQKVVNEDITLGILEFSEDSPLAKNVIYRWLRLADQEDVSQLDARAKATQKFVRDNIRELLVASVAGVGYDPRNPEAIDNHERLYCKTKPHFGYPGRPDITVEEVKDRRQSCAINDAGRTIFKAVFEYEEDKSTVKACTVYHQGSEKTFIPELVRQEIIGTTVDDFIAEHTFEAVVREDQVYKGLVQLMERGELTDDLRGSYEIETLFKLKGAYEMARLTDAGQGEAMDVEGKFSGNEIALFREALEYAGYSGRCSDLVMAIVRDDDTKDILGASFDNMRKIYGSQAYQQWERTAEAKQWRKEYRPFEPKMSLRARMRSTFAMKAVEE